MEPDTFLIKSPNLEIYQTDDLRKWIGIYLHACRSRNLAAGTIEFYAKKLNALPPQNRGMGILIMKYRARISGAELEVGNRSTGGTEVVCRFSCVVRPRAVEAAGWKNPSPES